MCGRACVDVKTAASSSTKDVKRSVAAIQVVQVVRCTRAYDPRRPTSEDQIAFFEKLISSVSHVASHSGYCREIVF